jgi:NO-binding membrane sensor protein with MHYT domain
VSAGCTAWATHFIILLAFKPGMPSAFNPLAVKPGMPSAFNPLAVRPFYGRSLM